MADVRELQDFERMVVAGSKPDPAELIKLVARLEKIEGKMSDKDQGTLSNIRGYLAGVPGSTNYRPPPKGRSRADEGDGWSVEPRRYREYLFDAKVLTKAYL